MQNVRARARLRACACANAFPGLGTRNISAIAGTCRSFNAFGAGSCSAKISAWRFVYISNWSTSPLFYSLPLTLIKLYKMFIDLFSTLYGVCLVRKYRRLCRSRHPYYSSLGVGRHNFKNV